MLTFSAGLAIMELEHIRSASEVLGEADEALYRAKQLGRNRVGHLVVQSTYANVPASGRL